MSRILFIAIRRDADDRYRQDPQADVAGAVLESPCRQPRKRKLLVGRNIN